MYRCTTATLQGLKHQAAIVSMRRQDTAMNIGAFVSYTVLIMTLPIYGRITAVAGSSGILAVVYKIW